MTRRFVLIISAAIVLAGGAAVRAQQWGRERFPSRGACFFRDPDYRGDYFCVGAGEDVRAVPDDMNDRISSIRLFGRARVFVFRDVRFKGNSSRFESSVRNLKGEGWNDRISSVRVQIDSQGGPDPDRIVRRAYQDVLGREPDDSGLREYRSRIIDDGWTERQVREALRDSPEYRDKTTMTRAKAEAIVRRAYLAVLNREPDAGGSAGYINAVLRNNWSQQDVERELRKSPEYRDRR
jgi:hypothetical protein